MSAPASSSGRTGGDALFFDHLYAEHHRAVYAYLLGHVVGREAAADLLQETYVRVWHHLDDARRVPCNRRRYWLLAIARNLVMDQRRRQVVRQRHEAAARQQPATSHSDSDPVHVLIARETAAMVDAAIANLPDGLRMVLTLHLVGDMTSEEIGRCLDIPAGTARYRLAMARRRVAAELNLCEEPHPGKRPDAK
jgi:RNA polymerase sigma-70 factor (ECF subfamily)